MIKKYENVSVTSSVTLALAVAMIGLFAFSFPAISNAATYAYVNTSGAVVNTTANSPSIAIATAPNIALHSGVILVNSNSNITAAPVVTTSGEQQIGYLYVNASGEVVYVDANSSADAFSGSINIGSHSGVMLISSLSDSQMIGNQVASR